MPVDLPRFDVGEGEGGASVRRGVPAVRVGGQLVTTVLDLMLAHYGVAPRRVCRATGRRAMTIPAPHTPAWQEPITGVECQLAARVGARVRA